RRPGLGLEFLAAIRAAVELIQRDPAGGSRVPGVKDEVPARRIVLRRFPYAVVFLELETEVRILAFAHARRRPGYWSGRLRPSHDSVCLAQRRDHGAPWPFDDREQRLVGPGAVDAGPATTSPPVAPTSPR